MMKNVAIFFLILLTTACNTVEDQRNLPTTHSAAVDPAPAIPKHQNVKHQVLIAVVDTGTDYNHPDLSSSIHYSVAPDGVTITGAGYDFIGSDPWPAPYLARTFALDPSASVDDKNLDASWTDAIQWLIGERPAYARFLNSYRLHAAENAFMIYHGTHVAGLAAYGDDRIGILPYRVLPVNRETTPGFEFEKAFVQNLVNAFDAAEKAGAKVVNLSLGASFKATDPSFPRLKRLESIFAAAVNSRPDMVFVAAAGNEASWINGVSRFSLPCGIKAKNLVCVGALKDDGSLAEFTNIPLIDSPLVFALGTEVLSSMPTGLCASDALSTIVEGSESKAIRDGKIADLPSMRRKVLDRVDQACNAATTKARLSGTSMATPIVSRLIAQLAIANPGLSGEKLIQLLLTTAQKSALGPLPIYKLKAPVPTSFLDERTITIPGLH